MREEKHSALDGVGEVKALSAVAANDALVRNGVDGTNHVLITPNCEDRLFEPREESAGAGSIGQAMTGSTPTREPPTNFKLSQYERATKCTRSEPCRPVVKRASIKRNGSFSAPVNPF